MEHKKNTRCTQMQIQLLQKYMANNKTIAINTTKSFIGQVEANKRAREWCALRALLRKHGPDKSVEKWKQTWRDLKRKHKKQKRNIVSNNKDHVEKKICDIINNDLDKILESSTVNADPLESIGEGGASIKEEPSMSPVEIELPTIDVNLDNPCPSPMQVILTNPESFAPTSSTSTQTNLPSVHKISNPPSSCAHENFSSIPASHNSSQCCHQNISPDAISRTNSLQIQQNALLQRLCDLLDQQNSNLRLRNTIERNKLRFEHRRF
ncbi:uncharacterized protein LOC123876235 isoform X2 [Maniola jurtina]|uniref:uncharacterized protein LOC123876235 isoform X2 n=1 Tax=Maniola jurtina TaxID=191418 RepID=UPI001E68E014|nr:uncharacterized protein LOC123876235 isoform X2 [Maniola jurtina]